MSTLDEKIQSMRAKVSPNWRPAAELIETIQAASIVVFGVDKERFFNGDKSRSVAQARMASMAISRQRTKLPLREIANLHGRQDHATVMNAKQMVERGKYDLTAGVAEILKLIDQKL